MADLLSLIQSAKTPAEVELLLRAMGQSTTPTAKPVVSGATNPLTVAAGQAMLQPAMAPASVEAAQRLLASMGQTTSAAKPAPVPSTPAAAPAATQYDPLTKAIGEALLSKAMSPVSAEAARKLLNSMGQTGKFAEGPAPTASAPTAAPVSSSKRATMDAAYADGNEQIKKLTEAQAAKKRQDVAVAMPATGKANTTGGADRVNAFTDIHGVTATTDPVTGRVTLTNIAANGQPTEQSQKQVYGFNPMSATTSSNVNSLATQLQQAKSVEEAQGISSSLRTALAEEKARLTSEAIKQAETSLGVHKIKAALASSEAMDQSKPGFVPGVGDSPGTLKLRQQLQQTQQQVEATANQWLARNISYARLGAAERNAKEDIKRIVVKGAEFERKRTLKEEADAAKEAINQEKAAVAYDGLSPAQKQVLVRLNPTLAEAGKEKEAIAYVTRQAKSDKDFVQIMEADPTEYKDLAFSGNKHAAALLATDEAARTGQSAAEVEDQIKRLSTMPVSPQMAQDYFLQKSSSAIGDKEALRKKDAARWNDLLSAKSPEEKKELSFLQAEIRRHAYKKAQTTAFMSNTLSWVPEGSPLRVAAQKALQVTGKADLDSTLRVLVEGQDAPTTLALLRQAKDEIAASAGKRQKSLLGGVDTLQALAAVDRAISDNQSFIDVIRQSVAGYKAPTPMLATPAGIGATAISQFLKF
jgi:hypothetical protein